MPSKQQRTSDRPLSTVSREHFWQHHVRHWRLSSLSKCAYCRDRGLTYHQFIYWHKRLSNVEFEGDPLPVAAQPFVPVALSTREPPRSPGLRLCLPNGLCIEGIDAHSVDCVGSLIAQL